jgi:carboxylesterase type B
VVSYKGVSKAVDKLCTKDNGVCHGTELPLVFGMPFVMPSLGTNDDRKASKNIIQLWTNFAKNNKADWPGFRKTDNGVVIPRVLDIHPIEGNQVMNDFKYLDCKMMEKHVLGL